MDAVTKSPVPVYDSQRGKALLDVFRQGLDLVSQRQTARTLGHREAYLGMSELARFTECPRAAVAAKLYPAPANLPRLLTLQRGHWFEQGVAESLAGLGIHALTQLEIRCEQGEMPLVAHCDLVLVWQQPRPAVRILEIAPRCPLRSCSGLAATPSRRAHSGNKKYGNAARQPLCRP